MTHLLGVNLYGQATKPAFDKLSETRYTLANPGYAGTRRPSYVEACSTQFSVIISSRSQTARIP